MRAKLRATVSAGELVRARCAATIAATVSVTPNSLLPLHHYRSKRYAIVYKGGSAGQARIGFFRQLFGGPSRRARAGLLASAAQFLDRFLLAHDLIGKPLHTFPDHALARDLAAALGDQPRRALVAGVNPQIGRASCRE